MKNYFSKTLAVNSNLGEAKVLPSSIAATVDNLEEDLVKIALENYGSKAVPYDTFTSRPADKINLPEVVSAQATFVYNYFTRDERVRNSKENFNERLVSLDASNTADIFHQLKNKKIPRYVKIKIKPPKIENSLISTVPVNQLDFDFQSSLNKIVTEGTTSSEVFTGVELIDTGKESNIYSILKGSAFFYDLPTERLSQKESAELLHSTLKEKESIEGVDKKLIVEAMTNISSEGYTLAPSDVSPEIANFANDPIGKQSFSVQFNNLLMADVIANSTIIPDNVYQDEVRGLEKFSRDIKSELLSSIPPANTFKEADYDLQVDAITQKNITGPQSFVDEFIKKFPEIKFIGYIIEKYEVLPNESVNFISRLFIQGHNSTYAIDNDVRYGGSYFYKIRSLCSVKVIASSEHKDDSSLNQNVLATMLMASEGVLAGVTCVEKVPPPPPNSMRITFDFEVIKPRITWQFPLNKQRDIKRFQIFKRFATNQPFTLLKEYNFDDSFVKGGVSEIAIDESIEELSGPRLSFVDMTHKEGEKPIYTVACVDAHGMSSNYGPQLQVERDKYTNRVHRKVISREGAPKPYPNMFLNVDAFEDCMKVSGYDRINVFLDPDHYKVTKYKKLNNQTNGELVSEIDLGLLAIDPKKARYKIQLINVDNQKDQIINIKLQNFASPNGIGENFFEVSPANFSDKNVSFQYGVE